MVSRTIGEHRQDARLACHRAASGTSVARMRAWLQPECRPSTVCSRQNAECKQAESVVATRNPMSSLRNARIRAWQEQNRSGQSLGKRAPPQNMPHCSKLAKATADLKTPKIYKIYQNLMQSASGEHVVRKSAGKNDSSKMGKQDKMKSNNSNR